VAGRLTFAISFGNHRFHLRINWIAAQEPQSVAELRRLDAVVAIMIKLGEHRLELYA